MKQWKQSRLNLGIMASLHTRHDFSHDTLSARAQKHRRSMVISALRNYSLNKSTDFQSDTTLHQQILTLSFYQGKS